uniref:Uncharacterized protein n=1 Tax=Rhizophora mucronata TaxID=61149 RepID=A0A2P2PQJ9_RHIMU
MGISKMSNYLVNKVLGASIRHPSIDYFDDYDDVLHNILTKHVNLELNYPQLHNYATANPTKRNEDPS